MDIYYFFYLASSGKLWMGILKHLILIDFDGL